MITACFDITPHESVSEVCQQIKKMGSIQYLSQIQEGWQFCAVWPSFEAVRDVFAYFLDQNTDFDVHWVGKTESVQKNVPKG